MGGKKKTKWRKLPLAEFTKDCSTTHAQKILTKQNLKTDLSKDGETQPSNPSNDFVTENPNQFRNECGEYSDEGMILPTTYLVYNPVDVPLYTNYIMPPDPYCYLPQEMAPVQDYVTMPYQEFRPPVKDTVYLLLPTPTLRSSHGLPYLTYDWRNRRRRRRYEGYAEYAVIPEKTNYSTNKEDKERGKKLSPNLALERNDFERNHIKTMTSFSETSSFPNENQKQGQEVSEKRSITSAEVSGEEINKDFSKLENMEYIQDKQNSKSRKEKDICGVHDGKLNKRNDLRNDEYNVSQKNVIVYANNIKGDSKDVNFNKRKIPDFHLESVEGVNKSYKNVPKNQMNCDRTAVIPLVNKDRDAVSTEVDSQNNFNNFITPIMKSLPGSTKQSIVSKENKSHESARENDETTRNAKEEKHEQSSTSQPLSEFSNISDETANLKNYLSLNETKTNQLQEHCFIEKLNEKLSLPKSILSQRSQDSDVELKNFTTLPSLKTNQSIYKLAFDENITDHSEESSRSPSPVDPETQVPRSLINNEILIHEADSGSEAGSEDIELIPHRYESETFLNENKHMYVNKLSLAVELLRTQENLPYDEQFKRVVGENDNVFKNSNDLTAEVNLGFVDDPPLSVEQSENIAANSNQNSFLIKQTNCLATNTGIFDSISSEDKFNDSCEEVKEELVERNNNQDSSGEVRAGYRRFQVNLRHYFTPRALVNPCLCCIIM